MTAEVLPTFLGIGAPKAGTTWLYQVLDSHPDVLMSQHRKEIHYFDLHFERGPGWYRGFFPAGEMSPVAVGEFTTSYLYGRDVPARVRSVPTIDRFVLTVRNPVDRAFSHYRFRQRQDNRSESFEAFLAREPNAIAWGCYARHLAAWFEAFDSDRFLVLVFEQAVREPDRTRAAIAEHLGLDQGRFPDVADEPANESFAPRHRRLYGAAVRQARWVRRHDLDPLITAVKRAGLVGLLKRPEASGPPVALSGDQRERLWERFADDVTSLEDLTGIDLAAWRPDGTSASPPPGASEGPAAGRDIEHRTWEGA